MSPKILASALGAAGGGLAMFAGCSLGLDASLIGSKDASSADVRPQDARTSAPDAQSEAAPPPQPDAGTCASDSDCTSSNGCLTGHCDATHACVFEICPTSTACTAAACSPTTNTCGSPASYGFQAGQVSLGAGVGCGVGPGQCIGASYPWVFVGTDQGVVAVDVVDPALSMPRILNVSGIPFYPEFIVQSGTRVYFVGNLQESGTLVMAPVAWIDPPADATATSLAAESAFVGYPQTPLSSAYGGGDAGMFLETASGSGVLAAFLTAPIADPTSVALYNTPLAASGEYLVGASASRLVAFRWDGELNVDAALFSLVTNAGTANATNLGEQSITASGFGQVGSYFSFGSGADGSFLFSATTITSDYTYPSLRFAWVLANGATTTFGGQTPVDVEEYSPAAGATGEPIDAPLAGPLAWIDSNHALVLAAAHETTNDTSVQVVTQSGGAAALEPSRFVLDTPTSATGAAASGGFGYVLTADSPTTATLHVVAPGCP